MSYDELFFFKKIPLYFNVFKTVKCMTNVLLSKYMYVLEFLQNFFRRYKNSNIFSVTISDGVPSSQAATTAAPSPFGLSIHGFVLTSHLPKHIYFTFFYFN